MSYSSLQLLKSGSDMEFIEALKQEISEHPAHHPPFLLSLANGSKKDPLSALRSYAHQYSFYSAHFTTYLNGVISQLANPEHKRMLEENMLEELGDPNSDLLENRPHVELFEIFKRAVGVTSTYSQVTPPLPSVKMWSSQFHQLCSSGPVGIGLGAIGLGTEWIVPQQYQYLLRGIERCPSLGEEARLFFDLHLVADDEHAEDLISITKAHAQTPREREAIRYGVFTALHLRKLFWEALDSSLSE